MIGVRHLQKVIGYNGQHVTFKQIKKDGMRLLVRNHPDGRVDALTRNGKSDHWPELKPILGMREILKRVPKGSALDCELYVPMQHATSVITHIKAHSPQLRLSCFAVPLWAGSDLRRGLWTSVETVLVTAGLSHVVSETTPVKMPVDVGFWKEEARRAGVEGYVFKREHYAGWYRVKPDETVDVVVMDTTMSTSDSFYGGLKALIVGVYTDGELRRLANVGSGFEADYRMTVDRKELVGRVAEVMFDSLAANGSLRFPRFIRWRDDKAPGECESCQLDHLR